MNTDLDPVGTAVPGEIPGEIVNEIFGRGRKDLVRRMFSAFDGYSKGMWP